jgi:hypothetical protein
VASSRSNYWRRRPDYPGSFADTQMDGMTASGAKRPFGEPTITLEAKAWLTSLPCRKAKELGYPHELWTTRLLARHAREHGPAEGHPCLANTKMAVARVAAADWSCAGSRGGCADPRHRASGCRRHTAGLRYHACASADIEIGNTVNPKDDSFTIDQLIYNTEDNEKGFANVSEVTGYSRIKMEGVCKTR